MENKKFTLKSVIVLFLVGIVLSSSNTIQAQLNNKFGILDFNKAVNISGKQRMLSQKMSKSYLYLITNPNDKQAKKDLLTSKIIFEKQNGIIRQNANFKSTKDKISRVDRIWKEFKTIIESTPNYDNAKRILDINTDLLKASNDVVSAVVLEAKGINQSDEEILEDDNDAEKDSELKKIINISGRQRMLAQRLGFYYYANQATLKNKNSEQMLRNVYNEIDGAITILLISDFNNTKIEEKLGVAMSKWNTLKDKKEKLFNQGLKLNEMYILSNELTNAFNEITSLYDDVK